jgi:curved DNA-binding protein
LQRTTPDHYALLGLDRDCSGEQIRAAYRLLAKQVHPDVNDAAPDSVERMQALNAAYETLVDETRRRAYDAELRAEEQRSRVKRGHVAPITQDVHLRITEFLRGITLDVRVTDPGHGPEPEIYQLEVPPETAPGTRFKIARDGGGVVAVRVRPRPDPRFKVRGSDIKCDLRITSQRAAQGGVEFVMGPTGNRLRVNIPRAVARGETLRIAGEGLPKPRGGRGDLLVRIVYRPEVRITRARAGS